MYAVVRTGGKQYRVTAGDIFEVEKLDGSVGDTITLEDVLLVSSEDDATIGQPTVEGASVTARITGQYRGKKILVFRYRPKKRIRVRRGHRQYLTRLEVESVSLNGSSYTTDDVQRELEAEREAALAAQREQEAELAAKREAEAEAAKAEAAEAEEGDEPIVDTTELSEATASQPVVDGEETPADESVAYEESIDGDADQPEVLGTETPAAEKPVDSEVEASTMDDSAGNEVSTTSEAEADPSTNPDAVETPENNAPENNAPENNAPEDNDNDSE